MYPHQVLMEENNLTKENLTIDSQGFLKDFNHYLNTVNMKLKRLEKQDKEAIVTEQEMAKLNRLSKSVVFQIYSEKKEEIESIKKRKIDENKAKEEAEVIKLQQEEDERNQILKIEEQKKKDKEKQELENQEREKQELENQERENQAILNAERQAEEIDIREIEVKRKKQEVEDNKDLFDYFF